MKKLILSSAVALSAFAVMPTAANAVEVVLEEGDGGTLTGEFGAVVRASGESGDFTREFTFTLPVDGTTAASISTVRVDAMTDINFTSVLLNGVAFSLSPNGGVEFGSIEGLATLAGVQTLVVNGFSGGNGSFAGTISFVPTAAVPEPGTWALLMLGFAAVGFSMRRKKPELRETRVRYNFA
ncbi:FxDxF family PEP-CTERM protein [Qipengyuania atrilutea]|nr:FxDxF family PEP-CTERM protein [Actirhodobacter atriluteus]